MRKRPMTFSDRWRVEPGAHVRLRDIDPDFTGKYKHHRDAAADLDAHNERMRDLQYLMYAGHEHSLLICLQALDAGGKDGTIRHVLASMNPQGTKVHSFKQPTREELDHDFLWRVHARTPGKGEVAIFNRSHYEDVLAVRVHRLVPDAVWAKRYDSINAFENTLMQGGTTILKFFLHISENEQLARFAKRLEDPARHWKITDADYEERALWPKYVEAYEEVFHRTSNRHAPWFVIPSNHKWFRNLAVSRIVVETMESLAMKLPRTTVDIGEIRRKYHSAEKSERRLARKIARAK